MESDLKDWEHKYVYCTEFTVQRYKLEEIVRSIGKMQAVSLLKHCYSCTFTDALQLYAMIVGGFRGDY